MTTPLCKQSSEDRAERLSLGKPHVFWHSESAEWLATGPGATENWDVVDYLVAQDERWTPRMNRD